MGQCPRCYVPFFEPNFTHFQVFVRAPPKLVPLATETISALRDDRLAEFRQLLFIGKSTSASASGANSNRGLRSVLGADEFLHPAPGIVGG
jgi:hypothetical protein